MVWVEKLPVKQRGFIILA